jgi:hypothetical protein
MRRVDVSTWTAQASSKASNDATGPLPWCLAGGSPTRGFALSHLLFKVLSVPPAQNSFPAPRRSLTGKPARLLSGTPKTKKQKVFNMSYCIGI